MEYNSLAYLTLKRRKSMSSAAASISACHAFFPWPRIVAAMILYLHFPANKSAAFKNIEARSFHGIDSHCSLAFNADVMADLVISGVAPQYLATQVLWEAGLGCSDTLPDLICSQFEITTEDTGSPLTIQGTTMGSWD